MRHQHEISRGWRGAPWGRRVAHDWTAALLPEPERPRIVWPMTLAVMLGIALGATIAQGLAQDDRARLDALKTAAGTG